MDNSSIWMQGINFEYLDPLSSSIKTDVLIIGGGMVGLSCGYFLKDSQKKVTIIERDSCGMGISARSTAKITLAQGLIYSKLINSLGENIASQYFDSQLEGMERLIGIIRDNKIECDLGEVDSYVFCEQEDGDFEKERNFYKKRGIDCAMVDKLPLEGYGMVKGLVVRNGYVFQPVKYMLGLRKILLDSKVNIYEKTEAHYIVFDKSKSEYVVKTNGGKICAKQVIVCTNYPFFLLPGLFPLYSCVEKSYVVAGEVKKAEKMSAISEDKFIQSIRFHENDNKAYVLFGGNSHEIAADINIGKRYEELVKCFREKFHCSFKYSWSNQDTMTVDLLPYAGLISKKYSNLFVISGFNKWGIISSCITSKVVGDMVMGNYNSYSSLFSFQRKKNLASYKQLILFNIKNMGRFVIMKLKGSYLRKGESAKVVVRNDELVGVYTDKKGQEHVVSNICPHMRCNLFFNVKDKTWDCPCHGSRFDIDGKVVFGPANCSIKIKK